MKNSTIIHSGYYERLVLSSILDDLNIKVVDYSSIEEFRLSQINNITDVLIYEVRSEAYHFSKDIEFIKPLQFFKKEQKIIVITNHQNRYSLEIISSLNIDLLLSARESIPILKKMICFAVSHPRGQILTSPLIDKILGCSAGLGSILTISELQVMKLVLGMKKNKFIAKELGKNSKVISSHKRNAMKKLGIKNNIELYKYLL